MVVPAEQVAEAHQVVTAVPAHTGETAQEQPARSGPVEARSGLAGRPPRPAAETRPGATARAALGRHGADPP